MSTSPLPLPEAPRPWWAVILTKLLTDDKALCRAAFLLALAAVCGVKLPVGSVLSTVLLSSAPSVVQAEPAATATPTATPAP